jgi:hypothetical protein
MRLVRFFLVPLRTARDIARVSDDGVQEASVTDEDREEENVVNDEYDSGYTGSTGDPRITGGPEQIIDYDKSVSEISGQPGVDCVRQTREVTTHEA